MDEAAFRAALDRECDNDMRSAIWMVKNGWMDPIPGVCDEVTCHNCRHEYKVGMGSTTCLRCFAERRTTGR